MTRIEAIRQLLKEAAKYPDATLTFEAVCELIHLWDTRETALRALVERLERLEAEDASHALNMAKHNAPESASYGHGKAIAYRVARNALSRLLEQEP